MERRNFCILNTIFPPCFLNKEFCISFSQGAWKGRCVSALNADLLSEVLGSPPDPRGVGGYAGERTSFHNENSHF